MQIKVTDKEITITLPIEEAVSKSGKSLVIASTHGNITTGQQYKGKDIIAGVNLYTKR